MQIGSFRFQPGLISSIVVLIGITILFSLGRWQLDRAEVKRVILQDVENRKTSKPMQLTELDTISDKNYYHLQVAGKFDNKHYLLLDNRIYKSKPGFEVIQPLVIKDRVVLVNRGWIPLPRDRNDLPTIPIIEQEMLVIGEVNIPGAAIVLKADQLSADKSWPQLVQSIEIEALTKLYQELGMKIEPWVLRQDADDDPFYRRLWFFVSMKPEQHIGYAVTWFGLALVLLIIYIAAVTTREETSIGTDKI